MTTGIAEMPGKKSVEKSRRDIRVEIYNQTYISVGRRLGILRKLADLSIAACADSAGTLTSIVKSRDPPRCTLMTNSPPATNPRTDAPNWQPKRGMREMLDSF